MNEVTEKKKWFERVKMPHTYVILITILVIMTVLTHIIPAGQYQRVEDPVSGKMIVVPGSFEFVDIKAPGFLTFSFHCSADMWMPPISCS